MQRAAPDGHIDFQALFNCLWQGKWWIVVCGLVSTIAFTAYAITAVPIYRAVAVLAPVKFQGSGAGLLSGALGQFGGLASMVGLTLGADSDTEEALAVLKSREFTERFIEEKGLLQRIYSDSWDSVQEKWKVSDDRIPTLSRANNYFNKAVRLVSQDKRTGLVSLQIDWRDRAEAAQWANELIERLNDEMRGRAREKAEASLGFLDEELAAAVDVSTKDAINRLIEAQIKQKMLINITREYSLTFVDKALPPDRIDYIWPKRRLLVILGAGLGGLVGVMIVLLKARYLPLSRGGSREH